MVTEVKTCCTGVAIRGRPPDLCPTMGHISLLIEEAEVGEEEFSWVNNETLRDDKGEVRREASSKPVLL